MREFHRRGLTPRQWKGWLVYMEYIPLPHDRADFATAMLRADVRRQYMKSVNVSELVPQYGKVRRNKTEAELKAQVAAHVAAKPKQTRKGKPHGK